MRILVTFSILWAICFSLPGPKETTVRYQSSGVIGRAETSDSLTIDSVPIVWSDRRNNGFFCVNTDCEVPFRIISRTIARSFNHTNANNHTYQRTRECVMEGLKVLRVSERIHYDGVEYMNLDSGANTWRAAVPQALALKQQWNRDHGRTVRHKIHLQNGCAELMKAFSRNNTNAPGSSTGASLGNILIPILVIVAFLCQFLITFFIAKRCSKQTGGVLGSIIHYPERSVGTTSSKGDPEENDFASTPAKGMKTSLLVVPA